MLTACYRPFSYQKMITAHQLQVAQGAVFADPGVGKTAATLHTIAIEKELGINRKRVLVIAPLAVALNTWPDEIKNWDKFKDLSFAVLHGKGKNQLSVEKDIDIINPEGLPWLFKTLSKSFRFFPYGRLVVDESTLFKNPSSLRSKILKFYLDRFERRTLLTGTPIPNSLIDLFGQVLLMDGGQALGRSITKYKRDYFYRVGLPEYDQWQAYPDAIGKVQSRIKHLVVRVDARDYRDFPPLKINRINVSLPPEAQRIYDEIEEIFFSKVDDEEILINSEASKYNALRQIAAGGLYEPLKWFDIPLNERRIFNIHSAKSDWLLSLFEEGQGKPLLVGYTYRFTAKHCEDRLSHIKKRFINGQTTQKQNKLTLDLWSKNKLQMLIGNPKSMGHGLNLHYCDCRSIVWFNPTDNFEHFDQFNRRIYGRNGVSEPVTVHLIIAKNTIEEVIYKRLDEKHTNQSNLLDGLKAYWQKKKGSK